MSKIILRVFTILFAIGIAGVLTGCASAETPQPLATAAPQQPTSEATQPPAPTDASSQIANPASQNCVKVGGKVMMQKRGDGGEYGACLFEDNRQCEEWALMRGNCPVGGLKITGYITDAAIYCAITGGEYKITSSNNGVELGDCTFGNGKTCDAADYFNGKCDPNSDAGSYSDPFAYCAAIGTADAPDANYTGDPLPDVIVQAMIEKGIVTADAPKEIQQHATWRCMDQKVWVCHFGANIPCTDKADTSQTPTAAMEDFCKANPAADVIPADVTGRTTIFEWKCADGKPAMSKTVLTVDPRGFITEYWYELTPK